MPVAIITERATPQGSSKVNPASQKPHTPRHAPGSQIYYCTYIKSVYKYIYIQNYIIACTLYVSILNHQKNAHFEQIF